MLMINGQLNLARLGISLEQEMGCEFLREGTRKKKHGEIRGTTHAENVIMAMQQ